MTDADYTIRIDWNDDGDYSDVGEDVTADVLGLRQGIGYRYGRDDARALSAVAPGDTSLTLYNGSGDYSPDNGSSPIAGLVTPGKKVSIQARHLAVTRDLFTGYIDDYELVPAPKDSTVTVSVMDMLSKLREAVPSTAVFGSVQTGGAIEALLDAIGWPEADRDIDSGATTIKWYWSDGDDALAALGKILEAEGPPAIAYADLDGTFVFRDRHHRLTRSASKTAQVIFTDKGPEPNFCEPYTYEIGWKDVVNSVVVDVSERDPEAEQVVWESADVLTLGALESRVLEVASDEPFIEAQVPEETTDYTLVSGTVNVSITRDSGQTTKIEITALTNAVIEGMRLRAKPLTVARELRVQIDDTASQDDFGLRTLQDADLELANRNDSEAIARIIVGQRAQRLPTVSFTVNNGNDTRFRHILDRKLSDRIHLVEKAQTFVDDDFYIESIEHNIEMVGEDHRVVFSCERCPASAGVTPNYFKFDSATAGFNEGVFAESGVSFTSAILILDDATNGALGSFGLGF